MPISVRKITQDEARGIVDRAEQHFWDFKSGQVAPAKLQKTVVAFPENANDFETTRTGIL